jgi:hypothetical protein
VIKPLEKNFSQGVFERQDYSYSFSISFLVAWYAITTRTGKATKQTIAIAICNARFINTAVINEIMQAIATICHLRLSHVALTINGNGVSLILRTTS